MHFSFREPPPSKWRLIHRLGKAFSWAMVPFILMARKPPVSTLTWIWAVLLFPFLGPVAYFFFGSAHMNKRRLRGREQSKAGHASGIGEQTFDPPAERLAGELDAADRGLVSLLSAINEEPTSVAAEVRLLVDARRFYPALIERVRAARHSVHVEFFIFRDDSAGGELLNAFTDAARRGVEVRLLVDQGGSWSVPAKFFRPLEEAGGKFSWFRTVEPFRNRWVFNLRNHRKVQVIDGERAFVGGMNVGREYLGLDPAYGSWRDVQMELSGPVAGTLQRTFADDWFFATEERLTDPRYYPTLGEDRDGPGPAAPGRHVVQILSDGPDTLEDPIQLSIVAMLNAARERAWLTAGYFVPYEPLLTALKLCAGRGVDTRLLISAKSDHPYLVQVGRSYYEELLRYGVRIYEYEKGMNHAKVAAFDGRWLMVGSANFDVRSMRLNFELNALVHAPGAAGELERVLRNDYEQDSVEIELEEFRRRPWTQRCLENAFRPLAPLL